MIIYGLKILLGSGGVIIPPDQSSKNEIKDFVDFAYFADEALNTEGEVAQEGEIINVIKDANGFHDLAYNGQGNPPLGRPKRFENGIEFLNQSQAFFSKDIAIQGVYTSLPEEFTVVLRQLEGQGFESLQGVFGGIYLGVGGLTGIRVLNSTIWLDPDIPLVFNGVSSIHVLVEEHEIEGQQQLGTKATVWYNGINIGTVETEEVHRRFKIGVSTETNAIEHIYLGSFHKLSKFEDADRAAYLQKVHTFFGLGELPAKPYATNVRYDFNAGTNVYTAAYDYNGLNAEDTGAVKYRWYERSGGAFQYTLLGTTPSIIYTGTGTVILQVQVYDVEGNTWRYVTID